MWFTKVFVLCFVFCGNLGLLKALPSPNLEIAGGSPVSASEAHYVVRISTSRGGCTGQLISPNYVLTAGHCVHNVATATIYLGYQKTADMLRATTRQAIDIKVHENYTPYPDTSNDLALLRLNQSVAETNRISIVKFPGKNEGVINYTDLVAYGWGRVADNQVTDVLRTAALKVTPCYNPKDKTVICTSRQQGKSVCKGDSGGPLVRPGDVLVGVTSSGECGYDPVYLSIFTRVDYYLDWIEKNSDAVIPN